MKARLSDYVKVDLYRAFGTWKMPVSILGIFLVFLYNSEKTNVIIWISSIGSVAILLMAALMIAAYPYVTAFCDDMEYRYDMQLMIRGSSFSYAVSKLFVVFLSAAVTMLAGFLLTVFYLRQKYGLLQDEVLQMLRDCQSWYYWLPLQKHYIMYYLCTGIQLASLAGVLAVIGLMCSLFVRNRMLASVTPIALLYIEDIVVQRFFGWAVGSTFSLRSMAITTLEVPLAGQTPRLYYFEVLMILFCVSSIVCWKNGRR